MNIRKILSVIIILSVLLSLITPYRINAVVCHVSSVAEFVLDGVTVNKLTADIDAGSEAVQLNEGENLIVDLNGFTWRAGDVVLAVFGGTCVATVYDSSAAKAGAIVSTGNDAISIINGELTLTDITVKGGDGGMDAIWVDGGKVTITNCTLSAGKAGINAANGSEVAGVPAIITVNGGKFASYANPGDRNCAIELRRSGAVGPKVTLNGPITFENNKVMIRNDYTKAVTDAIVGCAGTTVEFGAESAVAGRDNYKTCTITYTFPFKEGIAGNITYMLDDYGTLTIDGTGDMINYSSYSAVPWYYYRSSIKEVIVNDGVTSISDYAFFGCSNLVSVTIPDSVISIGNYAFESCYSLADVYYSGTEIQWKLISIGSNNTNLIDSNIIYSEASGKILLSGACGADVTFTLDDAGILKISGTGDMTNYTLSSAVPWYSVRLSVKKIIIENGVTNIADYAFFECSSLTSVVISDSVISIGDFAFENCTNITSILIPDGVVRIGEYAFYKCSSLELLKLGNNIKTIARNTFAYCSSLKSVIILDGVTSISDYAFFECSSLTSVIIPDSVISIGEYAFYKCSSLELLKLGNNIKTIARNTFAYCSSLESVIIPDSVKSIGSSAFYWCISLKYVKLGSGLKTIGNSAFIKCASLETLTVPDSVTYLGESVFKYCTAMKSVTVGGGIAIINDQTFFGCDSLANVYYTGTEEQWEKIVIASDNDPLWLATLNFCTHIYSEWVKNDELSDEDDACYERTCTECGFTESWIMCNHKFEVVTVAPTATTKGSKSNICKKCGELLEYEELDIIPEKMIIKSLPAKLTYSYGDALDLAGLVLSYSYTDGREDLIIADSDYTVNGFSSYSFGTQTLLIEIGNYKASFDVMVAMKTEPAGFSHKIEAGATVLVFAGLYRDATVYALTADGKNAVSDTDILKTGMILQIVHRDGTVDGVNVIVNGDLTGDGIVNGKDIIRLKKQILQGGAVEYIEYADINDDGIINEEDIVALMSL